MPNIFWMSIASCYRNLLEQCNLHTKLYRGVWGTTHNSICWRRLCEQAQKLWSHTAAWWLIKPISSRTENWRWCNHSACSIRSFSHGSNQRIVLWTAANDRITTVSGCWRYIYMHLWHLWVTCRNWPTPCSTCHHCWSKPWLWLCWDIQHFRFRRRRAAFLVPRCLSLNVGYQSPWSERWKRLDDVVDGISSLEKPILPVRPMWARNPGMTPCTLRYPNLARANHHLLTPHEARAWNLATFWPGFHGW